MKYRSKSTRPFYATVSRDLRRPGGFSLVEVSIALGILSFALVGIFGLVPVMMDTLQDSREAVIGQRIQQAIASTLSEQPLMPGSQRDFIFDSEGRVLGGTGPLPSFAINDAQYDVMIVSETGELPEAQTNFHFIQYTVTINNKITGERILLRTLGASQ